MERNFLTRYGDPNSAMLRCSFVFRYLERRRHPPRSSRAANLAELTKAVYGIGAKNACGQSGKGAISKLCAAENAWIKEMVMPVGEQIGRSSQGQHRDS
jgi:hypothetical protein